MRERPILFSGPLVRAILAGRKSVTRRVIKPQPPETVVRHCWFAAPKYGWTEEPESPARFWYTASCPYGVPGDRLWVRETHAIVPCSAGVEHYPEGYDPTVAPIHQLAGVSDMGVRYRATWEKCHSISWRPSIHMPRWASRIDLEVTGVRVERLQDISEEDAAAEGVCGGAPEDTFDSARAEFASSWDAIYADPDPDKDLGWQVNPWVWVVEFRPLAEVAP